MSADFPISFFYFISAYIGMFAFLKKYVNAGMLRSNPTSNASIIQSLNSQDETFNKSTVQLNYKEIAKHIINRWMRLAFPTYIIVFFTMFVFSYLGSGPAFNYINEYQLK